MTGASVREDPRGPFVLLSSKTREASTPEAVVLATTLHSGVATRQDIP